MKLFLAILLLFTVHILVVQSTFKEDAIFEDEDIYSPPLDPTRFGFIVPGTKWCGPGNSSKDHNDLGMFTDADKCCREHDHCAGVIEPKTTLHGLYNPDMFPRMSCDCEQKFLNCLQKVGTLAANMLGYGYFSARSTCFKLAFPVFDCTVYQRGVLGRRCVKYKFDTTKPKKWQYFDVPYYS